MKKEEINSHHNSSRDHTGSLPGMWDDSDLNHGATDGPQEAAIPGRPHKQLFRTEQEALEYRTAHGLVGRVPKFLEGRGKWALVFPLTCDQVVVRHQTEAEVDISRVPVVNTRVVEKHGAYAQLLQTAFDQICREDDWKGPIDALVPWEAASVYIEAIQFMTATTPTCVQMGVRAHLTSPGYRAGPAGDH